jgi:hypothetical protein|nr:MAG TPA: ADP-ribosyltransferase exoenzyme [Caudoviricetes sp.]
MRIKGIKKQISAINELIAKHIYKKALAKESILIEKAGMYNVFNTIESIDKWVDEDNNVVASPIKRETNYWDEKCYDTKDLYEMLEMYSGYKSENINHFLRLNKPIHAWNSEFEIEDTKKYISKIDTEMHQRALHCNVLAIRWVHLFNVPMCMGCQLSDIKIGRKYTDYGYMSSSLYLHYIGSYDETAARVINQHILLLLKLPAGSHGIYINKEISDRNEYEYIIDRNTTFTVEKIYYKFSRPLILVCKI